MTAAYERLAQVACHARQLACEGRFEQLAGALEQVGELRTALPASPPREAHDALRVATCAIAAVETAVASAMRELGAHAGRLEAGRAAARGYRAAAGSSSGAHGR